MDLQVLQEEILPIPRRPLVVHLEVTDACNENCDYCFQGFRDDPKFAYLFGQKRLAPRVQK